jgi:histidine triad (HIT) family protein
MAQARLVSQGSGDGLSVDRRQHLDYLQSAISRMASASAAAKTWLLPVATATYGYGLVNRSGGTTLLGVGAVALFAFLDARYLREERAFRALFRRAAHDKGRLFDMNSSVYYGRKNGGPNDRRVENCEWRHVFWSWSVAGFYGSIAAVGLAIAAFVIITSASHGGARP